MGLLRARNRTMYNLRVKIEPPSLCLLASYIFTDILIWVVQLYVIVISFISYEELSAECNIAYPEIGENCDYTVSGTRQRVENQTCATLRDMRFDGCQQSRECDIFISGQYNLENWSCEGADCVCASDQVYYAIPMLMVITFGMSFCFGISKCFICCKYFWSYLEIQDSRYFWLGYVSDNLWMNCCLWFCQPKSFEAVINFYYYKRKYFGYNYCSVSYIILRYIIFFIAAFIMFGLIDGLNQYQLDTIIYWYDILPLFILWIINELVIKLRYKCLPSYSKKEHVLFILAEVVGIDEYNVVRIIGDFMGPEDLADYAIVQEEDLVTMQPLYV